MAAVQMPDGTVVDMPDQLDPQLGARLRAFQTAHTPEPSPVDNLISAGKQYVDFGKGVVDAGLANLSGLATNIVGAPVALANRLVASATRGDGQAAADATHDFINSHFGYSPQTPVGQSIVNTERNLLGPVGQAASAAGDALDRGAQALGASPGFVHNQLSEAGDIAGSIPVVQGTAAGIDALRGANAAAAANAGADAWRARGFRSAADHPIAAGAAGSGGQQALILQNQQVGNTVTGAEAGVKPGSPLTPEALDRGAQPAIAVYDRVKQSLPAGPLSPNAAAKVQAVGNSQLIDANSDTANAIASLKQQFLGRDFSGSDLVDNLRNQRQEGYVRIGSDDVAQQKLGQAQLGIADALDQHIADSLPPGAGVSLDQFQQARQALAKNMAVRGSLKARNVDMLALARMQRETPELLTGGLADTAQFANQHPKVASLANSIEVAPSWQNDLGRAVGPSVTDSIKGSLFGPLGVQAAARRVLTGNPAEAMAAARQTPVTGLGGEFDRLTPDELSLTAPPGQAFEPHQPDLGTDPLRTSPGQLSLTAPPGQAFEPHQPGLGTDPLRTSPGQLSLTAPPGQAGQEPQQLPLSEYFAPGPRPTRTPRELGEMASSATSGPLSLVDDLFGAGAQVKQPDNSDHAGVMSQGVPEDILQRSKPPYKVNKRDVVRPNLSDKLGDSF